MFDAGPRDAPRSAWDLVGEIGRGTFRGGVGSDELACHRVFAAYERASDRFARAGKWAPNASAVLAQHERAPAARGKEENMARVDMKERGEVLVVALRKFIAQEGRNPSCAELGAFAGLTGPTKGAIAQAAKKALEPIRGNIVDWSKPGGVWPIYGGKPNAPAEKKKKPAAKKTAPRAKSPPPRAAREVPAAAPDAFSDVVSILISKRDALLAEVERIDRAIAALKPRDVNRAAALPEEVRALATA